MAARYGIQGKITTVYSSVPREVDTAPRGLRQRVGATDDTAIVLYTGQISRSRGLWEVVDAMPLVPDNVLFVTIGDKDQNELRQDVGPQDTEACWELQAEKLCEAVLNTP